MWQSVAVAEHGCPAMHQLSEPSPSVSDLPVSAQSAQSQSAQSGWSWSLPSDWNCPGARSVPNRDCALLESRWHRLWRYLDHLWETGHQASAVVASVPDLVILEMKPDQFHCGPWDHNFQSVSKEEGSLGSGFDWDNFAPWSTAKWRSREFGLQSGHFERHAVRGRKTFSQDFRLHWNQMAFAVSGALQKWLDSHPSKKYHHTVVDQFVPCSLLASYLEDPKSYLVTCWTWSSFVSKSTGLPRLNSNS